MELEKLTVPEFLLSEIPIKDGSIHDSRLFITCTQALSLIECVPPDINIVYDVPHRTYIYNKNELWTLYLVQNNCEATDKSEELLFIRAWQFLCAYIAWEDNNIDHGEININN